MFLSFGFRQSFRVLFLFSIVTIGSVEAKEVVPTQTTETYGTWTYRCQVLPAETIDNAADKACEMVQAIRDPKGNLIAQAAFGIEPQAEDQVIAVFQVPDGTILSEPVLFGVRSLEDRLSADYVTCFRRACLARTSVNQAELKAISNGEEGILQFVDRAGRTIQVLLSLDGFGSALERLSSN